jgi:hypothetical protein
MGFHKPKLPPVTANRQLEELQKQQLQASIDSLKNAPQLKLPDPVRFAAPPQNTAADVAAAERIARQNIARKRGIAYSINPA